MYKRDIVLASSSPYRQSLLEKIHIDFIVASPDIDESRKTGEDPEALAIRLAIEKCHAAGKQFRKHLIIASDQVAWLNAQQLHKPGNRQKTIQQLQKASGQQVYFYTSICVLDSDRQKYITDIDLCIVHFRHLSDTQIKHYVDIDKPYDCAGGFKVEKLGIALFESIKNEDPNSLIGLPLIKLIRILEKFGVRPI